LVSRGGGSRLCRGEVDYRVELKNFLDQYLFMHVITFVQFYRFQILCINDPRKLYALKLQARVLQQPQTPLIRPVDKQSRTKILVNFVSRHAVFYSQMCSVMGRNVQYFCERFGACSLDVIDSSKQWKLMADEGIVSRAGMIQELVIVSDGLLCMSTDDFTHNVVLALIEHSSFLNNFMHPTVKKTTQAIQS